MATDALSLPQLAQHYHAPSVTASVANPPHEASDPPPSSATYQPAPYEIQEPSVELDEPSDTFEATAPRQQPPPPAGLPPALSPPPPSAAAIGAPERSTDKSFDQLPPPPRPKAVTPTLETEELRLLAANKAREAEELKQHLRRVETQLLEARVQWGHAMTQRRQEHLDASQIREELAEAKEAAARKADEKFTKERARMNSALMRVRGERDELRDVCAQLQSQNKDLSMRIDQASQDRARRSKMERSKLQRTVEDMTDRLKAAEREVHLLEDRLGEQHSHQMKTQLVHIQQGDELARARDAHDRLHQDHESKVREVQRLRQENDVAERERRSLEEQLSAHLQWKERWEQDQAELKALRAEVNIAKSEASTAQRALDDLQHDHDGVVSELHSSRELANGTERRHAQAQQSAEAATSDAREWQNRYEAEFIAHKQRREEMQQMLKTYHELQTAFNTLGNDYETARMEVMRLHEELECSKREANLAKRAALHQTGERLVRGTRSTDGLVTSTLVPGRPAPTPLSLRPSGGQFHLPGQQPGELPEHIQAHLPVYMQAIQASLGTPQTQMSPSQLSQTQAGVVDRDGCSTVTGVADLHSITDGHSTKTGTTGASSRRSLKPKRQAPPTPTQSHTGQHVQHDIETDETSTSRLAPADAPQARDDRDEVNTVESELTVEFQTLSDDILRELQTKEGIAKFKAAFRTARPEITRSELRRVLAQCGFRPSQPAFGELLQVVDPDNSERITFLTFTKRIVEQGAVEDQIPYNFTHGRRNTTVATDSRLLMHLQMMQDQHLSTDYIKTMKNKAPGTFSRVHLSDDGQVVVRVGKPGEPSRSLSVAEFLQQSQEAE